MSTTADFVAYVQELAQLGERLTTHRMFGEYALYVDEKVVGFACDNTLFIKYLDQTTGLTAALPAGEAYPGSRPYAIADALLDEPKRLQALLLATAAALPPPRPKRPRKHSQKRSQKQPGKQAGSTVKAQANKPSWDPD